ncbi:hypothetical protein [Chryseobacterium luteum]|uniref:Uncharacterized protein n=1 Tax=Chryseobacterium luteum TaxID=421531 RepID=A0A085ZC87_9FLAO|nr:hypothetical protein [Chryseobacterium luteum]KFF02051.1 hypothetical protein IX38_16325 [Chryseobacterium luteum]
MTQYIFDTNYYRNKYHELGNIDDFDKQIIIEKEKSIKVLFPAIVGLELLNHFQDPDAVSVICYNSLKILIKHSHDNDGYSIVPTMYPLMCMDLYKKRSSLEDLNMNVFDLSTQVTVNSLEEFNKKFQTYITDVQKYIVTEKKIIIDNIEEKYIKELSPNSNNPDWEILKNDAKLNKEFRALIREKQMHKIIGLSFIHMAAEQTQSSGLPFDKEYFENSFMNDYKVSIDFFIEKIIKKLIDMPDLENFYNPTSDKKKRWNSFYDMQLILATEFENKCNRKTIYVTSDSKIITSFQDNGKEDLVIHSNDYDAYLRN